MIAHHPAKNASENYGRASRAGKRDTEAAAFAGVVVRDARLGHAGSAIARPGEGEGGARVFLVAYRRRYAIALVEPGGKHRPVGIERQRFETLALDVRRDRQRLGERAPAVARTAVENLAVESLVSESSECDGYAAVATDYDLRPCVRAPIEVERVGIEGDRRREAAAEIGGSCHRDAAAGRPGEPHRPVRCECRRHLGGAGEAGVGA